MAAAEAVLVVAQVAERAQELAAEQEQEPVARGLALVVLELVVPVLELVAPTPIPLQRIIVGLTLTRSIDGDIEAGTRRAFFTGPPPS